MKQTPKDLEEPKQGEKQSCRDVMALAGVERIGDIIGAHHTISTRR
jgi:hypothetical protein